MLRALPYTIALILILIGCDSGGEAPELSIEIVSPAEGDVLVQGAPFELKMTITSALDVRDLDIQVLPMDRAIPSSAAFSYEEVRIRQGPTVKAFVVDTTLVVPELEGRPSGPFHMALMLPSGTTNVWALTQVRVE